MTLSSLLTQRRALLQQARLANLAYAYERLSCFAERVERARLTGEVRLQQAVPELQRFCASLTALQGRQSVLDEHFSDEDIMDLADVLAYVTGDCEFDATFRIEDLHDQFLTPVHRQLSKEGVIIDKAPHTGGVPDFDNGWNCTENDDSHRSSPGLEA